MKLSGTMIGTHQPVELAAFYTKILGEPAFKQDDWSGFGEKDYYLMIGPHSEVSGQNKEPQRLMYTFIVDDVEAEAKKIMAAGAKVIAEPYKPDPSNDEMWLATFADPDGNYFQISTPYNM